MSLVLVEVETFEGSTYSFPDMNSDVVNALFCTEGLKDIRRLGALTMANLSKACMVIPSKIIAAIHIDGYEVWRSSASTVKPK